MRISLFDAAVRVLPPKWKPGSRMFVQKPEMIQFFRLVGRVGAHVDNATEKSSSFLPQKKDVNRHLWHVQQYLQLANRFLNERIHHRKQYQFDSIMCFVFAEFDLDAACVALSPMRACHLDQLQSRR